MKDRRIAVVGGGLAGLAAAEAASRAGARVVVFERSDRVGGRAGTDELEGVRLDPGAQLFGSMYTRFLALVGRLGLADRLVAVPGRDAVWRDGRAHEVVYGSVASMAASGGLPFRTKVRLGTHYVPFLLRHARSLDVHSPERAAAEGLDGETIAAWGARELDDAFVDSLVYPQLGAYYGALPEETSAGFYHILARYGMDVELYAVRGGVGRIAERVSALVRERGGEVRTACEVEGIALTRGGAELAVAFGSESFDGVVAAIPAPLLPGRLDGVPDPLAEWISGVEYRPVVTVGLVLERPLERRFFGLSYPRGTRRWLSALALQESKGVPMEPPGRGALVAFIAPERVADLIGMESRSVLDRVLPEILETLPEVDGRVVRARIYRYPEGSPVMRPGYLGRLGHFRRASLEQELPLALAGDYLYGASVEGAVLSGEQAVERLARRWGAGAGSG